MNLVRPTVTNGDFVAYLCKSDTLFPNDFGEDLFIFKTNRVVESKLPCGASASQLHSREEKLSRRTVKD